MFTAAGRLQGANKASGGGIPGDPYYNDVVLLMHMNGFNNSTDFPDQKGHTITRQGLPVVSTAQSMFGGASAYFPGGGTTYLETNTDTGFDLSSGNWTIELWFYVVGFGSNGLTHLIGTANSLTGVGGWSIRLAANEIALTGNNNSQGNYATTVTTGVWHNVTVVRNGTGANSVQLYLDGVALTATGNNAGNAQFASTNGPIYIGQHPSSPQTYLNGYVDEVRVTKGIARYTANFTPTGPFPDTQFNLNWGGTWDSAFNTGAGTNLTNGDLTGNIGGNGVVRGGNAYNAGLRFIEMRVESYSNTLGPIMGFNIDSATSYAPPFNGFFLVNTGQYQLLINGVFGSTIALPATYVLGVDKIGFLYDIGAGTISIYLNRTAIPGAVITGIPVDMWRPVAASPGGAYGASVTIFTQ